MERNGKRSAAAAAAVIAAGLCIPALVYASTQDADVIDRIEEIQGIVGEYDILSEQINIKNALYATFRTDVYSNYTPADEIADNSYYQRTSYVVGGESGWSTVSLGSVADDGTGQLCVYSSLSSIIVDDEVDTDSIALEYSYRKYATVENGYLTVADIDGDVAEDLTSLQSAAEELTDFEDNTSVRRVSQYCSYIYGDEVEDSVIVTTLTVCQDDDGNWVTSSLDNPMTITMRTDQTILINVDVPDGCESVSLAGFYIDLLNSETGELMETCSSAYTTNTDIAWHVFFNFGSYDGEILLGGDELNSFAGTLIAPAASVVVNSDSAGISSAGQCICREFTNYAIWNGLGEYRDLNESIEEDEDDTSVLFTVVFLDEDGDVITDSVTLRTICLVRTDEDYTVLENYAGSSYGEYYLYGYNRHFTVDPAASGSSTRYYYLADADSDGEMLARIAVSRDEDGNKVIDLPDGDVIYITLTDEYLGDAQYPSSYSSYKDADIYISLSVPVVCLDEDGSAPEQYNAAGLYTFALQETDATYTSAVGEAVTAVNDADGLVWFTDIYYTTEDIGYHYYTITQLEGEDPNITYDTDPLPIRVLVERYSAGEEGIEYLQAYLDDPASIQTVTNLYTAPEPALVSISLSKLLSDSAGTGRELQDGEFTFILQDSDGNEIGTAVNDADGEITFDPITFTEAGEYSFTVTESVPENEDSHISYDGSVIQITIIVTQEDDALVAQLETS